MIIVGGGTCADESLGTGETPYAFIAEGAVGGSYEGSAFEAVGSGSRLDLSYR